jgi:hypothetical protein
LLYTVSTSELVVHQAGRRGNRLVGADGHRWFGHEIGRGDPVHLRPHALAGHALHRPGQAALKRLLGQQVGLGDDPDHLVVVVDDGKSAEPLTMQHLRHFLVLGAPADGDHVGAHDVLDG